MLTILILNISIVKAGGATDCPLYPSCSNKIETDRVCTNVLSRGFLIDKSLWYVERCNAETITYKCSDETSCTFGRWNMEDFYILKKIILFPSSRR